MAAVSLKNFLAPLQNKMQLGTILIVAVLVVLFRVSGGSVTTESSSRSVDRSYDFESSDPESDRRQPSALQDTRNSRSERPRQAATTGMQRNGNGSDPLADLLKSSEPSLSPPAPTAPTTRNLSEVRKALGLE